MNYLFTKLTARAIAICKTNYKACGKGNGCDRCPIHAECRAPCGGGIEEVNRHTVRVNAAAEKVAL